MMSDDVPYHTIRQMSGRPTPETIRRSIWAIIEAAMVWHEHEWSRLSNETPEDVLDLFNAISELKCDVQTSVRAPNTGVGLHH